tara:strand:+ start:1113 stop:1589 length:477 start_codon:yes stop_codon:yes gene_type:complete
MKPGEVGYSILNRKPGGLFVEIQQDPSTTAWLEDVEWTGYCIGTDNGDRTRSLSGYKDALLVDYGPICNGWCTDYLRISGDALEIVRRIYETAPDSQFRVIAIVGKGKALLEAKGFELLCSTESVDWWVFPAFVDSEVCNRIRGLRSEHQIVEILNND